MSGEDERITVHEGQVTAFNHAVREYDTEFRRRNLHYLVAPDPADCPPPARCPHCGEPVESSAQSIVSGPSGWQVLLDMTPCGDLLVAAIPHGWDFLA